MDVLLVPILIVGVILLLILGLLFMWKKAPQGKALVITGLKKRVITGGGGLVVPFLERCDKISLENIKIEVYIDGALTEQGVNINADGVAVIKVKSDTESILAAVEQFNTGHEAETIAAIKDTAKDVLEGKLREIVSKLTVEEIYKNREKFASQVQEVAAVDLAEMGLEIKVFTIRDISDSSGYLQALCAGKIAQVKRDAEIAKAEASKEITIKTAQALIARKQKEIELVEQEAIRKEKELDATVRKQAEAEKYKREKEAEALKYKEIQDAEARAKAIELEGRAKAEALKVQGMAEVEIIREKGKAEAEVMKQKAEAFKLYNDTAVIPMIIEKLPEIAMVITDLLSKTEKIVIINNGNGQDKGVSKVTDHVTDIISQLPETVEALTDINITDLLSNNKNKSDNKPDATDDIVDKE